LPAAHGSLDYSCRVLQLERPDARGRVASDSPVTRPRNSSHSSNFDLLGNRLQLVVWLDHTFAARTANWRTEWHKQPRTPQWVNQAGKLGSESPALKVTKHRHMSPWQGLPFRESASG